MLPDEPRGHLTGLKIVLVVAAFLLGSLSIGTVIAQHSGLDDAKRAADRAAVAVEAQKQNTLRTECFRSISATLDEARWDLIFSLLGTTSRSDVAAIGKRGKALPNVISLADHGGMVNGERIIPCPPPPQGVPSGDHNGT